MQLKPNYIYIVHFSSMINGKNLLSRLRESSRRIHHDYKIKPLRELYKEYFESVIWLPPKGELQVYNRLVVKSQLHSKILRQILAQVPVYVVSVEEIEEEEYNLIIDSMPVMIRRRLVE